MTNYCQHCGARIKEFKISLSKNSINVLLTIWKMASKEKPYLETKEIYTKISHASPTAELTKLKYLGAIEPYFTASDADKLSHRSGKWIITKKGYEFIQRIGTLPCYVNVRNEKVIGFGDEILINDPTIRWMTEDAIWKDLKEYWGGL